MTATTTTTAYLIGTAALTTGLLSLASPHHAQTLYGIPVSVSASASTSASPSPSASTSALTAAKGIGLCYVAFGARNDVAALRTLMVAHAVAGFVDAGVVWVLGVREKSWAHAVGSLGMVGAVLGGWIR